MKSKWIIFQGDIGQVCQNVVKTSNVSYLDGKKIRGIYQFHLDTFIVENINKEKSTVLSIVGIRKLRTICHSFEELH